MARNKHNAPDLQIVRAEDIAGRFDAPRNPEQAEAEAVELTEGPGGIFTFSNVRQVVRRSRHYEREAIAYREEALEGLK